VANLVYKRVSTDQQSTARQNLVLDEAGIEDPVVFEEDGGTSSRLHPLQRPKFGALLDYARPGDTVHISEMFRLVRGTGHILDVLDVLHHDRLALRIHDGAFSAMDLTARHPRTGEPLSTVKFMVQTLAAAGELQRDLQRELTYDGLRAAEAKGSKGGRRPAVPADKTGAVQPGTGSSGRAAAHSASVMSVGYRRCRSGRSAAVAVHVRKAITRWSSRVGLPGHWHGRLRHRGLLLLYGFDSHELFRRPRLHAWPRPDHPIREPAFDHHPLKIDKTTATKTAIAGRW
jgi:DNA invertase Pin-like site-specific DNA recombinase